MESKSRLTALFERKKDSVLNIYCTAGFPKLESTLEVMQSLERNGADIIELGMPYSDPLADGPVIQQSGNTSLQNGMSIEKLFSQLDGFRSSISLPVILMGYLNPLLQFGFERFCASAKHVGIDGLIIPDLPQPEFEREYKNMVKAAGLDFVFLVTPETSAERIRALDASSTGFLYAVSSSSLTGSNKNFDDANAYLRRLKDMNLNNPVLVGFGVRDRPSFQSASKHVNGAIIGSAYIQAIANASSVDDATSVFLRSILNENKE